MTDNNVLTLDVSISAWVDDLEGLTIKQAYELFQLANYWNEFIKSK